MKMSCFNCGKELDMRVDKIDIRSYKNPITLNEEISIHIFHQTFCKDCGELLCGVQRKILTYEEILKLMEDKKYGKH